MKLFLDASVLLAACGSTKGSSRVLFHHAPNLDWTLTTSPYIINEVVHNLPKLEAKATADWIDLRRSLVVVDDVLTVNLPVIFKASKDRPVLFTALAWTHTLLTLDRKDFSDLLGGDFYGLRVRLPHEFLREERAAGRLSIDII